MPATNLHPAMVPFELYADWLRMVVAISALAMPMLTLSGCHWVVCGPPETEVRREGPCG